MKVRGEAQIIVRDIRTNEIISDSTQSNIITDFFYGRIALANQICSASIVITSASMESSRFTSGFPSNNYNNVYSSFPNSFVPANGNWSQYFAPTETTDGMLQFSGRYSAPAIGTSRTIRSVGLGAGLTSYSYQFSFTVSDNNNYLSPSGSGNNFYTMAFLKLDTPCIQTDTQVLDVYYRLYFPRDISASEYTLKEWQRLLKTWADTSTGYSFYSQVSPFKIPTLKSYDDGKSPVSFKALLQSTVFKSWVNSFPLQYLPSLTTSGNSPPLTNPTSTAPIPPMTRVMSYTDPNFFDAPGYIFNSMIFSHSSIPEGSIWPTAYSILGNANTSKVGNLIGQATLLSDLTNNATSSPYLDVDNLPSGTGKVFLSGSWSQSGTPSSPGLYYAYEFPERVQIKIETNGQVGAATYKLLKQKVVNFRSSIGSGGSNVTLNAYSANRYFPESIHALGSSLKYRRFNYSGGPPNPEETPYDYDNTIMGLIDDGSWEVEQISSSERYDDSSIIIVKKNLILLYNIAAGDYWKYFGSYTNIHQVAVMNQRIYVACRNTGLWTIDPYVSLSPTNITSPGSGIDLSKCNGVSKGYGNTIWVVANNCLASFDGTTWTKYDSLTSPAFSFTGISDDNWGNVEYIKVDQESSTNQMLLVRKFNATVDSTSLGVWWSTDGVASNAGVEPQSNSTQYGRPRIHRRHVGGLAGMWVVFSSSFFRVTTFGSTTITPINISYQSDSSYNQINPLFHSVTFVKNSSNQVRLALHKVIDVTQSGNPSQDFRFSFYLVDNSGTITDTLTNVNSGMSVAMNDLYQQRGQSGDWSPRTTSVVGYSGFRDQSASFILTPGLMVIVVAEDSLTSGNFNFIVGGSMVYVTQYGLDKTPSGGSLAYLSRQEYGWNGSTWVLNETGSKLTHSDAQPIFNGISARFQNGDAGTSFVSPNRYIYTASDGLFKDNATRLNYYSTNYYFRKVFKNATDLQSTTVPAATTLSTGIVGIDVYRSSANMSVNVDNEVVFPGLNTRQYAIGDKEVTGDFIISISATALSSKKYTMFGVTRHEFVQVGQIGFGIAIVDTTPYFYDHGAIFSIPSINNISQVTSFEISRTGEVLTVKVNTQSRNHGNQIIRPADKRLSIIWGLWDTLDSTAYNNVKGPAITITSNGSDNGVYFGNPVTKTASYNSMFFGVDCWTPGVTSVTLNGTPAVIKNNGTAPEPGEVTIDGFKGIMYFNSADTGKTIAANYLYQQS